MKIKLLLVLLVALLEGCVVAPVGRYYPSRSYYPMIVPHHFHRHRGHHDHW